MFGQKARRITELQQTAAARAARITELEDEAKGLRYSSRHNAQLADRLGGRDELRACARYRTEAAALRRELATARAAYDNAVGLDSPALDLGAHWQQRRSDRPVPKAVES